MNTETPTTINQSTRTTIIPVALISISLGMIGMAGWVAWEGLFGIDKIQKKSPPILNSDALKPEAVSRLLVKTSLDAQRIDRAAKSAIAKANARRKTPTFQNFFLEHNGGVPDAYKNNSQPITTATAAKILHIQPGKLKTNTARTAAKDVEQWYTIMMNDGADLEAMATELRTTPGVTSVEQDVAYSATAIELGLPREETPGSEEGGGLVVNDPFYSSTGTWSQSYRDQWGLQNSDVTGAWSSNPGSPVIVAVNDTGIDYTHAELIPQLWVNPHEQVGDSNDDGCPGVCNIDDDLDGQIDEGSIIDDDENGYDDDIHGWDATGNSNGQDYHGHGTHVAGIIAAATNNNRGISGIGRNVQLMSAEGLSSDGYGYASWLAQSIIYAVDHGAQVINMSWGGTNYSQLIEDAINYADAQGVVLVASAGNMGADTDLFFPASLSHVITVGATDVNNSLAIFSNIGRRVDVVAPGVDILSLRGNGTDMSCRVGPDFCLPQNSMIVRDAEGRAEYYRSSGTSMAAPFVTGTIALIRSQAPMFSSLLIKDILQNTGLPVSENQYKLLQVSAALQLTQNLIGHAQPDIVITDAHASNSTTTNGQVKIRLLNQGTTDLPSTTVRITFGSSPRAAYIDSLVPVLRSGQSIVQTVSYQPNMRSDLTVSITADYLNQANEMLEDNNTTSIVIEPLPFNGWPQEISQSLSTSSAATGDLNNDGELEIVIGDWEGKIFAFQANGQVVPGWPIQLPSYRTIYSTPAIADITGDTKPEVVVTTADGSIFALRQKPTNASQWEIAPGWPVSVGAGITGTMSGIIIASSVAIGDIDGNRVADVVATAADGKVYALQGNGAAVAGWPVQTPSAIYTTPIIADLDNNGRLDIITSTTQSGLYAWKSDGTLFPGWPVAMNGIVLSNPAIADIDKDGVVDIIYADGPQYAEDGELAYMKIIRGNGTVKKSWSITKGNAPAPVLFPLSTVTTGNSPTLADLDRDGKTDILLNVLQQGKYYTQAWNTNGQLLSGWPKELPELAVPNQPAVANIDADLFPEVLVTDRTIGLRAWNADGSLVPGWSKRVESWLYFIGSVSTPTIADLNGDKRQEVLVGARGGSLYIWSAAQQSTSLQSPWPTASQNLYRSNASTPTPATPSSIRQPPRTGE